MINSFTSSLAAGGLAVGTALGAAIIPEGPEDIIHLTVDTLEYVEIDGLGAVRQQITPAGGGIVPADWQARIERRDERGINHILCEGSGIGRYSGEIDVWALDDWAYPGDCPDLSEPGDIFEVSWSYKDEHGWPVHIGGRFQLDDSKALVRVD